MRRGGSDYERKEEEGEGLYDPGARRTRGDETKMTVLAGENGG